MKKYAGFIIAFLIAQTSYAGWGLKDLDPFNKNSGVRKSFHKDSGKSTQCLLSLAASGAYGYQCTACVASGTTATVLNPFLGVTYSVCVPICAKTASFVIAAKEQCGVNL